MTSIRDSRIFLADHRKIRLPIIGGNLQRYCAVFLGQHGFLPYSGGFSEIYTDVLVMLFVGYRLSGSRYPWQGRLEVEVSGRWGTVCDDAFTEVEAQVACHSLGFG